MADTFTPNRNIILMQTGNDQGIWGALLNADALSVIDNNLGGNLPKSVAGNSDVTLSSSEAENLYYNFTGALTGNINVIWPAGAGFYIVQNNTTGAFTLTIKPTGGTGVVLPQSSTSLAFVSTNTGTAFLIGGATGTAGGDLTGTYPNPTIAKIQGTSVSGTTGTTNVVFSSSPSISSPTLTTPNIGAATGTSLQLSGLTASELLATDGSKNLVSLTALPNGTTATTQTAGDTTAKVATNQFVNTTALTLASGTTAITQSSSDSSTLVATTAFVHSVGGGTLTPGTNGYATFTSGLVVQWGQSNVNGTSSATINLPTTFPTSAFIAVATIVGTNLGFTADVVSLSTTQIVLYNPNSSTVPVNWIALGH